MTDKQQGRPAQDEKTGYDNEITTVTPEQAREAEEQRNQQLKDDAERAAEQPSSHYNAHTGEGVTGEAEQYAEPDKTTQTGQPIRDRDQTQSSR